MATRAILGIAHSNERRRLEGLMARVRIMKHVPLPFVERNRMA